MGWRRWVIVPALLAALAAAAGAEELTWSADDPFADADVIEIDLGAELTDVSSVEFHAYGTLGVQAYWCMVCCDPEGFGGSQPIYPQLLFEQYDLYGEALATASMTTSIGPGEWILAAQPEPGSEDWAFLADGLFAVMKSGYREPYPYPFPYCYGIPGGTPLQIDRLEMTITCGSIVAEEASSWGRVKALYR